jgi:Fe-S cluster assembly protein SufD
LSLSTAIRTRDVAELPGKRDEDWRWTDLRGLLRVLPEPSKAYEGALPAGPFDALAAQQVLVVNGRDDQTLEVAAGAEVTLALRFVSRQAGAHASKVSISLAPGARATLLESHEGDGESYVAQASLAISLGVGARMERVVLAMDGAEGVSVCDAQLSLSPKAAYSQTLVTSGARRQRLETTVTHSGGHAAVRLDGVYLLADKRHADLTTVVDHLGPDGSTKQLTKGVVRDQARAVFQGRIVVAQGADGTDARMGHHALILSDRAEVDAKPELQIYADDVSCAHGNTVGALDDEAMFYARQRGIPEPEARAMLTEAFIGEVIDRIGHDGAREVIRTWVSEGLRG